MRVLLANPRGFCAGVDRAIEIVERALQIHGAPIYVRHEVVHNKFVTDDLRSKGAVFVEDLSEVPAGSTLIFSAHGVSQGVRREAEARGLKVFDAICPLVTKVHVEVAKMREQGRQVAANQSVTAYLVDNARELQPAWVAGKARIGVTAGASAPEVLVWEVVTRLKELGASEVSDLSGITERVTFPLPKNLSAEVS